MKYCINCKHYSASTVYPSDMQYSKCSVSSPVSLVDGKRPLAYCVAARLSSGNCGPEGKLFEPSRTPDHRDGRNPRYDDDWGSPIAETAPDGRLLKDVHNG